MLVVLLVVVQCVSVRGCVGAWVRRCVGARVIKRASERTRARLYVVSGSVRGERTPPLTVSTTLPSSDVRPAGSPAQASRTAIAPRVSGDSLGLTPVRGIETPGPMVRASRSYA